MDYPGSGANQETDHHGVTLAGYFPYISLVFKLTATPIILLLSGWVVYTIKTTRHLHIPHNIFVVNLLVAGMITTLIDCFMSSSMIISYVLSVESFISCYALKLQLIPYNTINLSFVIIAADNVITIRFPFKHKRMMTPRVVAAIVSGLWLIAVIPTASTMIFNVDGVLEVPQYGACFYDGNAVVEAIFVFILPIVVASILAIALNVYLALKAFQVLKQIKKESRLTGTTIQSERITSLKKKQRNIKHNRKPIITLLVLILGSTFIPLCLAPLHILGRYYIKSQAYQDIMEYVIVVNIGYIIRFFHPVVYGLYFKQVREPMMACWKRLNKVNSVAPQ